MTGGEPTLDFDKLIQVSNIIRENTDTPIYLYTNGMLLDYSKTMNLVNLIDGVNIGLHIYSYNEYTQLIKAIEINTMIPCRIHCWENKVDEHLIRTCRYYEMPLKAWKMDQCDTVYEDSFILE